MLTSVLLLLTAACACDDPAVFRARERLFMAPFAGYMFMGWIDATGDLAVVYASTPAKVGSRHGFVSGPGPLIEGLPGRLALEYISGRLIPGHEDPSDGSGMFGWFIPKIGGEVTDFKDYHPDTADRPIYNLPGVFLKKSQLPRGPSTLEPAEKRFPFTPQSEEEYLKLAEGTPKVYLVRIGSYWYAGTRAKTGEWLPHPKLKPRKERPTQENFVDFYPAKFEGKPVYEYRSGRLILGAIERDEKSDRLLFVPKLGSRILAADAPEVDPKIPVYNQPESAKRPD